mmetsp:Transcript_36495/g.113799  ORF Transcript_36495/g.113799 Transcript_36495/m.113799 type:complete len:96 (+) Transcript_36495:1045-1332(+)
MPYCWMKYSDRHTCGLATPTPSELARPPKSALSCSFEPEPSQASPRRYLRLLGAEFSSSPCYLEKVRYVDPLDSSESYLSGRVGRRWRAIGGVQS